MTARHRSVDSHRNIHIIRHICASVRAQAKATEMCLHLMQSGDIRRCIQRQFVLLPNERHTRTHAHWQRLTVHSENLSNNS